MRMRARLCSFSVPTVPGAEPEAPVFREGVRARTLWRRDHKGGGDRSVHRLFDRRHLWCGETRAWDLRAPSLPGRARATQTSHETRCEVTRRELRRYRGSPNDFSRGLFAPLPSRYDALAALLSMGQDRRWRSAMIDRVVGSQPQVILDVACGPCGVTKKLARASTARIVGLDLSEEMIRVGQTKVARAGLGERISLVIGRGEALPFPDATFDALTFTYLLRYVQDPAATLRELARVVKPGGTIASLEFAVPSQRRWRRAWWFYTRAVLPVAGLLTGGRAWWRVGRFLGPSISLHYRSFPVTWTVEAWRSAGIDHVETRSMSLGGGLVMSGYRAE